MNSYFSEANPGAPSPGDALAPLIRSPTQVEVVLYCAAIRNFHRLHYDETYTRSQGIDGLIVPGFLMGNWCIEASTRGLGAGWQVVGLRFRNAGLAYVGDTFTTTGSVVDVASDGDGCTQVRCELTVRDSSGETVTSGEVRLRSEDPV